MYTRNEQFGRRHPRGITSVLAMLYLVLFATLAVGFYASTTIQSQVVHNDEGSARALTACESGASFMRYQLANMNLPYGTTNANLLANARTALGFCLNGTPNMGGSTVAITSGTIHIPSATGWISLDDSTNMRFRASITQTAGTNTLVCTVRGWAGPSSVSRAIRVSYRPVSGSYALAGLNGVTMGGSAYTDSYNSAAGPYNAATAGKKGSIVSNGSISLSGTVTVNGDARPGWNKQVHELDDASVTGRKTPMPNSVAYPSVTMPPSGTYYDLGDIDRSSGTINIPGGTYYIRNLRLRGTAAINWQGPVTLYIGESYHVSDSVVINTYQNKPINRTLRFLPTCATATWTGTNVCVGELYAPDTDFTVGGNVVKFGRITAKSIVNTSSGGMHTDEAMPSPGGSGHYEPVPGSYVEVP